MIFRCTITRDNEKQWRVRHADRGVGSVEVTAGSRERAVEKMRNELRYRLELCPCTGEQFKDLEIELVEAGP
jgi:hypothetical protein